MSWKKSSDAMMERFERMLPADPRVERRMMFGCPMGFANGNIFLGVHEDRFIIRLAEDDRAAFVKAYKAKVFEPMPGRKSKATLVVPERVAADEDLLRSWRDKALSHALSLPPKAKKAVSKKTAPVGKAARGRGAAVRR